MILLFNMVSILRLISELIVIASSPNLIVSKNPVLLLLIVHVISDNNIKLTIPSKPII